MLIAFRIDFQYWPYAFASAAGYTTVAAVTISSGGWAQPWESWPPLCTGGFRSGRLNDLLPAFCETFTEHRIEGGQKIF